MENPKTLHKEVVLKYFELVVGKPEGKRPLRIPRHRREYNIKNDLQEVRCRVLT